MLGSKFKNCYYWYNDQYMYFSFNGQHSSRYNLFIQNNKELTIENTVGAASEYSNAMLQEGTYYLGTSRKQKIFKRKCAAEGLTLNEYKHMMKWLTVGTAGELIFDSDIYWGRTVVLDTVGDATFKGDNNFLVVEFELTFKTIGTYLAHSVYPGTWIYNYDDNDLNSIYQDIIGTNEYGIPTVVAAKTGKQIDFYIQNISNEHQNFDIFIDSVDEPITEESEFGLTIADDDNVYCQAEFSTSRITDPISTIQYVSNLSTLYVDDQVAEENTRCVETFQPSGIIHIPSYEPVYFDYTRQERDPFTKLTLSTEDMAAFESGDFDYVCLSVRGPQFTPYGVSTVDIDQYITNTTSVLCYKESLDLPNNLINHAYISRYRITGNQIELLDIAGSIANKLKDAKLYCGYSKHFIFKLDIDTGDKFQWEKPSYSIKITSYNNL